MDALQGFVYAMEPSSNFTIRLEEQDGDQGENVTPSIYQKWHSLCVLLASVRNLKKEKTEGSSGANSHHTTTSNATSIYLFHTTRCWRYSPVPRVFADSLLGVEPSLFSKRIWYG